jgi:mannosyl-oligosaccharide alpha-1,2-mannosidase
MNQTEAHPFLTAPNLKPGSQKLWTPPSPDSPELDLGVRAQGTDAQKWSRLDVLYKVQGRHPPPVQDGGGKGMGGGGGDPNHRPKAPGF